MGYNVIKIFKGADHAAVAKLARSSKLLGKSITLLGISSIVMTIMTANAYNRIWRLEDRVDDIEADVKRIKTFNNSCNKSK